MEKLMTVISELESKIPDSNKTCLEISQSSIGWHIQHSLLVIMQIAYTLKNSNPDAYKGKFSFIKTFIYVIGKIPRGKVKAPKSVHPEGEIDKETIYNNLKVVKENIKELNSIHLNSFFTHPYFGNLNLKPARTFLIIHTTHHLKIINDIIKKNKFLRIT